MPTPILYQCHQREAYLFRFRRPDNGKRTTLRLGPVSHRRAVEVGTHIDTILECIQYDADLPPQLTNWLSRLHDDVYELFVRCGLLAERETVSSPDLGTLLTTYQNLKSGGSGRTGGWKSGTVANRKQSADDLLRYFKTGKLLKDINAGEAEEWYRWMQDAKPKGRGLAAATASKKVKDARQFFDFAKKKGFIETNPFVGIRISSQENPDRLCEVPAARVSKVLEQIEDPEFRLIVALARYAGLRIPSEATSLLWQDFDFQNKRMHIAAPKTAHHRGGGLRVCPLFAELLPYFRAVHTKQSKPTDRVFVRLGGKGKNLRTQFIRYMEAAGVDPWPKPFQNCRANALTDLAEKHPIHIVCKWLGNTLDVAMRHYVIIKKRDYSGPDPDSASN